MAHQIKNKFMSIGILGGGVWGSALARVLSKNKVLIYSRDQNIVKSIMAAADKIRDEANVEKKEIA